MNSVYLVKGINIQLIKDMQLPTNPHDLVERFSCDSSLSDCMNSDCEECATTDISLQSVEYGRDKDHVIKYYELSTKKYKRLSVDAEDATDLLNERIRVLKRHIFVKRDQNCVSIPSKTIYKKLKSCYK